jgi:hypothetical protein
MNFLRMALKECRLWREYRWDRLRWLLHERTDSLARTSFRLGEIDYAYFVHPYNHTWANERAAEIPVVLRFLESSDSKSILEIGNVLSHYTNSDHIVVDKNEKCLYRKVINEDFMEFRPAGQFDAIVSISTFEHVGWDEIPKDEAKSMSALLRIKSMLTPAGKALVTFPAGYNHYLDAHVEELASEGATFQCLKRISGENLWIEVALADALKCKYGTPFMNANAVIFISLKGSGMES